MKAQFKAGDSVQWSTYGKVKQGVIVQNPNGSVAIIRDSATWNRTWAHIDSLQLIAAFPS